MFPQSMLQTHRISHDFLFYPFTVKSLFLRSVTMRSSGPQNSALKLQLPNEAPEISAECAAKLQQVGTLITDSAMIAFRVKNRILKHSIISSEQLQYNDSV
jgi:hypothetical protein